MHILSILLRRYIVSVFLLLLFSCSKTSLPSASPPVVETVTNIGVNVTDVMKVLTGNEVGVNMNYLMDDAVLPGQNTGTVEQSIKTMGVKFLRYPGGEKSDNYLFSAPPYTSAAPGAAYCAWPSTESRFFNADLTCKNAVLDFDEFMSIANNTRSDVLIVVPYDAMYSNITTCIKPTKAFLIDHAKEWVRYANITKGYNVKYWMIGNESFLTTTYNGFTTANQYAIDITAFADAMRSVDPTIKIIANGKTDWWQTILQSPAADKIDYLANSNYLGSAFTSYAYYRDNRPDLNGETNNAINAINSFTTGANRDRIKVMESEYNSIAFATNGWPLQNNTGHALCNFQMLADGLLKPKLAASFLWNTRWITNQTEPQNIYDALDANGNLNATGKALKILSENLLNSMVTTSDGGFIKAYATYNNTDKKLKIFLINKDDAPQKIKLSLTNYLTTFNYQVNEFKGTSADDKFPTWATDAAIKTGNSVPLSLVLPRNSVTMLSMQ